MPLLKTIHQKIRSFLKKLSRKELEETIIRLKEENELLKQKIQQIEEYTLKQEQATLNLWVVPEVAKKGGIQEEWTRKGKKITSITKRKVYTKYEYTYWVTDEEGYVNSERRDMIKHTYTTGFNGLIIDNPAFILLEDKPELRDRAQVFGLCKITITTTAGTVLGQTETNFYIRHGEVLR